MFLKQVNSCNILQVAERKAVEDIHNLENDLVEIQRQRDILSPRAIQQGWVQELDKNIFLLRKSTTETKLDAIFNKSKLSQKLQGYLIQRKNEITDLLAYRKNIADFRNLV